MRFHNFTNFIYYISHYIVDALNITKVTNNMDGKKYYIVTGTSIT